MSMKEFEILSKLGEGAFSVVYKVKRLSDGLEYALKKVSASCKQQVKMAQLSLKEKENAVNEVRILASIKYHPDLLLLATLISSHTSRRFSRTARVRCAL
jgi:NIMA (never in mitosis gene a)-related kinase